MDYELLGALCNADALAGDEEEVRQVIRSELSQLGWVERTDGLGSLIYSKENSKNSQSVMLCGHMDEVGFMVRTIDELGLIHLMKVGGVQTYGQCYQHVRVTTQDGRKVKGMAIAQYQNETVQRVFCDIGAQSREEVEALGIQTGDMVTFDTDFKAYQVANIYAGKAMDNRLACYIMCQLAKRLDQVDLPYNLHLAFTSSEEVGIRGARTAAQMINPDSVFVIDVATAPNQLIRDHTNQRQMGQGPILTFFDRTLSPNRKMTQYIREIAKDKGIKIQCDMFNSGGTDGGEAHKVHDGKPTVVTIVPVRYGHCTASLVNSRDVDQMTDLFQAILESLDSAKLTQFRQF